MEDKKSNARIAWDEFIGKFSLGKENAPEFAPVLQAASGGQSVFGDQPEEKTHDVCDSGENMSGEERLPPVFGEMTAPSGETGAVLPRTTIIGENVEINGSCKVDGDIEIYGVINGDVSAGGKISVFGKIVGNLSGANIFLSSADVKGSCISEGTIELDNASNLSDGKIVARNIVSNGNTSCDMEISGIARFHSSAHVTGDIRTARISIEEGAIIKGAIISE